MASDSRVGEQEMLALAEATPSRLQEKYVAAAARYVELAETREQLADEAMRLPSTTQNDT